MNSLSLMMIGFSPGVAVGWLCSSYFFRMFKRIDWETAALEEYREGDAAFMTAEIMAKRRQLFDSGRSHPARSDAGRPARVSRVRVKPAGQKRADPKL